MTSTRRLRKRKQEQQESKRILLAKKPRKMEAEDLNRVKFNAAGPLIMDQGLQGPVKHALEDDYSEAIQGVQFDAHQNEIVDIGTNVELLHVNDATCSIEEVGGKKKKVTSSIKRNPRRHKKH
ncbi:hypothetical protein RB195_020405 [Necator americanus]|uniref:Uncharacterized protein n=1 Tax=Necator americanus TaxID=51031 RepID=A0ABR1CIP5_NECAM